MEHRKICIKLSGAALAGDGPNNFDEMSLSLIAEEILSLANSGVEVCHGRRGKSLPRESSRSMGD